VVIGLVIRGKRRAVKDRMFSGGRRSLAPISAKRPPNGSNGLIDVVRCHAGVVTRVFDQEREFPIAGFKIDLDIGTRIAHEPKADVVRGLVGLELVDTDAWYRRAQRCDNLVDGFLGDTPSSNNRGIPCNQVH
jgi:hypothetical protein